MKFIETNLQGCFVIEPTIFHDSRGYFFESFNQRLFQANVGTQIEFVQDNESKSKYGVLRGLHYQCGAYAQSKLVRVVSGEIMDVVVDVRPESKTYGCHFSILLSDQNLKQLFIPKGFAHGFIVLSSIAVVNYKTDNFYNKESEAGIVYSDEDLKIDWKLETNELTLSDKDLQLPKFKNSKPIW